MLFYRRAKLIPLLALALFMFSGRGWAQTPALDFIGYTPNWEFTQSSYVIGWYFRTTAAVSVSALGWYNDSNGLQDDHPVGIYDIGAGQFVATTTVLKTDPLTNLFRYRDLAAPVILQANKQYALVGVSFRDRYLSFIPNLTHIATDPRISYSGGAIDYVGEATQLGPPVQYFALGSYWPATNMKISGVPAGTITAISPSAVRARSASFQMTITGSGFNLGSVVRFNNTPLSLFSVSDTSIVVNVLGNLLSLQRTYNVTVETNSVLSNALPFRVTSPTENLGAPRLTIVGVVRTGTDPFSGAKYSVLLVRNSGGSDATNIALNDVRFYYDRNQPTQYITPTSMALETGATPPGNLSRTAPGEILQIRWDWPTTINGPVRNGNISIRGTSAQGAFNAGTRFLQFP